MFCKIGKFTGTYISVPVPLFYFNIIQRWSLKLYQKRFWQTCFSKNFVKFLRTHFLHISYVRLPYIFEVFAWILITLLFFFKIYWKSIFEGTFKKLLRLNVSCFSKHQLLQDYFSRILLFLVQTMLFQKQNPEFSSASILMFKNLHLLPSLWCE